MPVFWTLFSNYGNLSITASLPYLTKCYAFELMKKWTTGSHTDTTSQFRVEHILEHLSILFQ